MSINDIRNCYEVIIHRLKYWKVAEFSLLRLTFCVKGSLRKWILSIFMIGIFGEDSEGKFFSLNDVLFTPKLWIASIWNIEDILPAMYLESFTRKEKVNLDFSRRSADKRRLSSGPV